MTQRTVTAFFTDRSEAMQSVERLAEAGIPRSAIRILPETGAAADTSIAGLRTDSAYTGSSRSTYSEGTGTSYDTSRDEKGFWASLAELFMPDEDRYSSAEAMNRGDIMVTATVDDSMAAMAEDILEEYGTVNIADRETAWRSEGWKGYGDTGGTRSTSPGGEGVIAIAEETLRVGKRAVDQGRVKVRSYVVETPVSEDVSLRDETVHIDRRPADRKLTDREAGDLFQERTIEVEQRGEEAVVSKTARVREEVAVGKTIDERTETIRDNVRHTEVEVEDERTGAKTRRRAG